MTRIDRFSRLRNAILPVGVLGGLTGLGIVFISCGTSTPSGPAGGGVTGPQDMHCVGVQPQPTDTVACQESPPVDAPPAPDSPDAPPEYGATMFNGSGDDDDCKYHTEWTSTPIREHEDVYFTVKAICLATGTACTAGAPATGANIFAEVFQGTTHVAPPTNQAATEDPPGTYKIGPIEFDDSGSGAPGSDGLSTGDPWTVRFHLHENCLDLEPDSPHGHAAYYLNVP
jgi:hypothetical protein